MTQNEADHHLDCRIIPGPKPSAWDVTIEAEKRGLGALQQAGFETGAMRACGFPCVPPTSKRRAAWEQAGIDWCTAEIARRAEVAAAK
jgi:hypothetical protein